jgi:predicted outer membrane lipoprotein
MGRSCGSACSYRAHEPLTEAGWQAWDVLLRCSGQIRAVPGAVLGLDFSAAFAIGQALGYDHVALAELLPAGEAGMIAAINERLKRDSA